MTFEHRCQLVDVDTPGLRCREEVEVYRNLICCGPDDNGRVIRRLGICGPHDVILQAQALCVLAAGEPFVAA